MTKNTQAPFTPSHTVTRNADNPYHSGFDDPLLMVCQDADAHDCQERLDRLLIQIHAITTAVSIASDPKATDSPISPDIQRNALWGVTGLLEQAMMVNSYTSLIELHQKKGASK